MKFFTFWKALKAKPAKIIQPPVDWPKYENPPPPPKKLLGKHVKYSDETAKETPGMIRREYNRKIKKAREKLKELNNDRQNIVFQIDPRSDETMHGKKRWRILSKEFYAHSGYYDSFHGTAIEVDKGVLEIKVTPEHLKNVLDYNKEIESKIVEADKELNEMEVEFSKFTVEYGGKNS